MPNFRYDKNGNLTTDADDRDFVFNGDNKQIEAKDANGVAVGRYFYDGEGKRVKKVTNAETTVFVYSAGKLVAGYSTQLATQPSTNYTTTDHLGSPRIITDALGQVKSRRDFMPFGEELSFSVGSRSTIPSYGPNNGDNIRQKFTGYQRDTESGLDYAQARYYASGSGRFTSVDPLMASARTTNPQTFNRYTYVLNNPYRYVDPSGMDPSALDDQTEQAFGHLRELTERADAERQVIEDKAREEAEKKKKQQEAAQNGQNQQQTSPANGQQGQAPSNQNNGSNNAPEVVLDDVDLVDTDKAETTDVLQEGDRAALGGPMVDANGQRQRIKEGAGLFLRLKFSIIGGAGRGSFRTKEDADGSDSFKASTASSSRWKIPSDPTVDAGDKSATIYIPLKLDEGSSQRITVKATVTWVDQIETGIPGQIQTNVTKSKTYSFGPVVKFKLND